MNRGDKRTRRVRDRDFMKFERSRRYRDRYRYRCQEKKSRRGRARDLVFRDPPTPRTRAQSLFAVRDSPPPALCSVPEFIEKCSVADPELGSGIGCFLTPGSGIRNRFFPDPRSQDHIFKSFLTIFLVKSSIIL